MSVKSPTEASSPAATKVHSEWLDRAALSALVTRGRDVEGTVPGCAADCTGGYLLPRKAPESQSLGWRPSGFGDGAHRSSGRRPHVLWGGGGGEGYPCVASLSLLATG